MLGMGAFRDIWMGAFSCALLGMVFFSCAERGAFSACFDGILNR